ncbi:hypothetical protein Angca_007560 [Angiostrongylus cantonensis]|nr:hypothetical protein Angca_007560 [Angiostrongylus cantonensis]
MGVDSPEIGQCMIGCLSSVKNTVGRLILFTFVQRLLNVVMDPPILLKHISCISVGTVVLLDWVQKVELIMAIVFGSVFLILLLLFSLPHKGFVVMVASISLIVYLQYLVPVSDFIAVRGILMILSMKISSLAFDKGHDFALSDAVPAFAFLFNPSTMVFGPFHTYGDFLKSMNRGTNREELSNALLSVSLLVVALSFLMYSSCLSIIVPEGSILADYFVAQSFRSSHFFVCLLSQALSMLSGMRISVCSPFKVEFPRSLVEVVTVWNMPMHRFLRYYVYLKFLSLGSAGSIFASFVVSSLLHGNWRTLCLNSLFSVSAVYLLIYLGAPFGDDGAEVGYDMFMTEKSESLAEIASALNHLSDELDKFEATWDTNMSKVLSSTNLYDRELFSDGGAPELSVTAQILLEEVTSRGEETLTQMLAHHKSLHHAVSQIGKDIEKATHKDIGGLIRNEKEIERDAKAERLVNGMICDYLMTCGLTNVAEILVKEAALGGRIDDYFANRKVIDWIMESLRNQDIAPAVAWLKQNPHSDSKLHYDLLQQHIVALIQDGKRIEALQFGKQLSPFGYEQETARLMGAVVLAKDCNDPRYEALFNPLAWPLLESRMSVALAQSDSRFGNVISTGMRAVPILMNLKQVMVNRQDHLFSGEELPVEVKIDEYVHSTFTCPILRQQSTDNNPPMRLTCGHVISREAISKLCSNHRNNRLKCPYCPEESHQNDAKQVYF